MSDGLISINIGVVFTVISLIMLVYSMKKMKENQDEKNGMGQNPENCDRSGFSHTGGIRS